MSATLLEYLKEHRNEPASASLRIRDGINDGTFCLMEAVLASLFYEGKRVDEKTVTATAVDHLRRFYRRSPLEANHRLDATVALVVANASDPVDRSKAIFDWILAHIEYGKTRRGPVGYRTSLETFTTREGVCGEMAILFVAMATLAGVPSAYVSVRRDPRGREVRHACASILDPRTERPILVDPAFLAFGIDHEEHRFLNPSDLDRRFVAFRTMLRPARSDMETPETAFPD